MSILMIPAASVFTARRYASAVYAKIRLYVRMSVTSRSSTHLKFRVLIDAWK